MQVFVAQFRLALERTHYEVNKNGQVCLPTETANGLNLVDNDIIKVTVITDDV